MARIPSRRLVIDASIARAAGNLSMHPSSQSCRQFLLAVLEICHRAVMTPPIKEEWDKHQSGFARRWRLSMVARKKLDVIPVDESRSLEKHISRLAERPRIVAIMEKDCHLIEAALASDQRIASLDDEVRAQFEKHRDLLPELRSICWVNPSALDEDVCDWLRKGAPADRERMLGYFPRRA